MKRPAPGLPSPSSDFSHGNAGLVGGGLLANEFIRLPYLFAGVRPPGEPRWGKAHKDFQRRYYKRCLRLVGPIQEMPNFSARVSVDPSGERLLGHPRLPPLRLAARLRPAIGRVPLEKGRGHHQGSRRASASGGAVWAWASAAASTRPGPAAWATIPKTSVTNRFGQVHQIDNLFVADASLHVTNGGFNPVLTIMAWPTGFPTTSRPTGKRASSNHEADTFLPAQARAVGRAICRGGRRGRLDLLSLRRSPQHLRLVPRDDRRPLRLVRIGACLRALPQLPRRLADARRPCPPRARQPRRAAFLRQCRTSRSA